MSTKKEQRRRRFRIESWNYDTCGEAYILAKDICPKKENVPAFICEEDNLDPACAPDMVVNEGWCRWEARTDWEGGDGTPSCWYVIHEERVPRSFPVWIVRKEEWY